MAELAIPPEVVRRPYARHEAADTNLGIPHPLAHLRLRWRRKVLQVVLVRERANPGLTVLLPGRVEAAFWKHDAASARDVLRCHGVKERLNDCENGFTFGLSPGRARPLSLQRRVRKRRQQHGKKEP